MLAWSAGAAEYHGPPYENDGDAIKNMDTCKIGPGVYQYTAVDDCTRYKINEDKPLKSEIAQLLLSDLVR